MLSPLSSRQNYIEARHCSVSFSWEQTENAPTSWWVSNFIILFFLLTLSTEICNVLDMVANATCWIIWWFMSNTGRTSYIAWTCWWRKFILSFLVSWWTHKTFSVQLSTNFLCRFASYHGVSSSSGFLFVSVLLSPGTWPALGGSRNMAICDRHTREMVQEQTAQSESVQTVNTWVT